MFLIPNNYCHKFTLLYAITPNKANAIPQILLTVTGFPITNKDAATTNILFDELATAYVKEVTIDITLKANIFCNQLSMPSVNNKPNTL